MSELDPGIVRRLRELAASDPGLQVLTDDEVEQTLGRVTDRFVPEGENPWWWEVLQDAQRAPVSIGREALLQQIEQASDLVQERATPGEGALELLITGGALPPWVGVRGSRLALLGMLHRMPQHEFMIVAPKGAWLVFASGGDVLLVG